MKGRAHGDPGHVSSLGHLSAGSDMKILALSDYFDDYRENRASFRVRLQTASKMSELGHEVRFVYPGSGMACRKSTVTQRLLQQSTPGLLPMRLRVGGFGVLDMIMKSVIVLMGEYDVIHVTNGHRPSQFVPCLVGKFLKRAVVVDECWEWLGRGGYSEKRRGCWGSWLLHTTGTWSFLSRESSTI